VYFRDELFAERQLLLRDIGKRQYHHRLGLAAGALVDGD
jgi:hypothetical protein